MFNFKYLFETLKGFSNVKSLKELTSYLKTNKSDLEKIVLILLIILIIILAAFGNKDVELSDASADMSVISYEQENEENEVESISGPMYVDIGGGVMHPGVYEVTKGTRVFQVVEMAGGLAPDANTDRINQAEEVYDGEKIMVPKNGDETINNESGDENNRSSGINDTGITADGKIDLNTASGELLQTIPGIGPAKSSAIISYREQHKFKSIEEITNISGIGSKTYESIKDYITV